MINLQEFIKGKKITQLTLGKSGAEVYDFDGEKILKHVCRDKLRENQFETYKKEALFYQSQMNGEGQAYIPQIFQVELSQDEIILLMKKYPLLERKNKNEELIKKIAGVLAEHPATFDETPLNETASNINKIIEWHAAEPRILTHGDFHSDRANP